MSAVAEPAKATGTEVVPDDKIARGFRYGKHKFEAVGLTAPPRVSSVRFNSKRCSSPNARLMKGGRWKGFSPRLRCVFIEYKWTNPFLWTAMPTASIPTIGEL